MTGLDDDLPAGVRVVPSADRSTLTVDVDQRAEPINTTLQYQVADATEDPSRYAWGSVTISVQDRPDPVTQPQVTGFGDRTLDVAFGAGGFNNSPITGYEISLVDAAGGEVLDTSSCAATTCTVPTPGQRAGQRRARPHPGPQRHRPLRCGRGAGTRSGPTSSRRRPRDFAPSRSTGGSASSGRRSTPAAEARSARTS